MRVLVLGSVVVGVTAAYYLARQGHEVTVVDRQPAAGMETSFANAGQNSPGYSAPWAAPRYSDQGHEVADDEAPATGVWPRTELRLWGWLAHMLANCTEEAYRRNKSRMVALAEYSRDCLRELRQETGITYDHRKQGLLQLFRTQKQLDGIAEDTAVLDAYDVPYEILDRAGCIGVEPALGLIGGKVAGGLRLLGDETGDAHLFTQRLAAIAEQLGVRFRYGTPVQKRLTEGERISGVQVSGGEVLTADAYVAAMGSYTPQLDKPLGILLPVCPVKGYSLTMPIVNPNAAPVSTMMDETFKVGITRLGDRIRVGGTAELAGFSQRLRAPRRATLEHSVGDLFPQGGDVRQASFWTGLRPMTPDGTPVVGPTRYKNLFTNTGHGTLGWTMACGSGRVLADLISGRVPEVSHKDLAADRYKVEWRFQGA